ncbi:alpha/beta hydrolase [Mycolicibacterium sp. S2-37]|uniref:alpha/beta fold hydrolase n=1 Tax=Mycolicibacterium sp. S2-37 TaxID=2810297 RepID=UPI001A94227E|nr:alpha/beta hydrolase [Mycolicibacterium sp. S2-37]MBO0678775.1 alpha/beta hydrolase [Mycolicibacterium sp. S2-37]
MIQAITLRDGRRLAYRAYGPSDGVPTVFLPGAGCGRLMWFGDGELLAERGVRLLSLDRPGLGASTLDPGKTFETVAADVAELVDTLVGEPAVVVANSQGAPFGLGVAARTRARGLVLVSPIDDVGHPPVTAMLPESYRAVVAAAIADPEGAQRRLTDFTAETLYDMVTTGYPRSDAAVYECAEFRAQFKAALQDAFASGAAGYARDTVIAMRPWPSDLFDPGVPVRILFGRDDSVHSPDLGAQLTSRIRGASRDVVDGVGGSLLWSHPGLVLDTALALAGRGN